jgi:hypothetical protein
MRELVDVHFPHAEVIRVLLDNLNTHTPAALRDEADSRPAFTISLITSKGTSSAEYSRTARKLLIAQ